MPSLTQRLIAALRGSRSRRRPELKTPSPAERLDAARQRLKQTIEPAPDGTPR